MDKVEIRPFPYPTHENWARQMHTGNVMSVCYTSRNGINRSIGIYRNFVTGYQLNMLDFVITCNLENTRDDLFTNYSERGIIALTCTYIK